jgi:hypothetical protein
VSPRDLVAQANMICAIGRIPAPKLPPMPQRGRARKPSDASALLDAVAVVLDGREMPRVAVVSDKRGPRWISVAGEIVANVKGTAVIVRAVRDGLRHGEDVIPQAQHTPNDDPEQAKKIAFDIQIRHEARAAERARMKASRQPATYQPYQDTWPRYEVPVREDDAAEGHLYSYVRADELTDEEKADLSPEARAQVDADLAAMDAGAAIGADDERIDHEHPVHNAETLGECEAEAIAAE